MIKKNLNNYKNYYKKDKIKNNKYRLINKCYFNKKYHKIENISKFAKVNFFVKFSILFLLLVIFIAYFGVSNEYRLSIKKRINDYKNKKFVIFHRHDCPSCGLFSFFIIHLGCINKFLLEGYIPIVDLQSFINIYNRGNKSMYNPWELFFCQPFNYSLEEVKKYAKNIKYLSCNGGGFRPDEINIYYYKYRINFWKNISNTYSPVKDEIMQEVKIIIKKLFGKSKNILGVKIRGTDYVKKRPRGHSVQPNVDQVISDVKNFDLKYNYDFIFFASEDELIKKKFIPEFKDKLKILNPDDDRYMIKFRDKQYEHLNYVKNYLFNTIILSKCLDLISSRCTGATGIILLSKGFRHLIIYNLGVY